MNTINFVTDLMAVGGGGQVMPRGKTPGLTSRLEAMLGHSTKRRKTGREKALKERNEFSFE